MTGDLSTTSIDRTRVLGDFVRQICCEVASQSVEEIST